MDVIAKVNKLTREVTLLKRQLYQQRYYNKKTFPKRQVTQRERYAQHLLSLNRLKRDFMERFGKLHITTTRGGGERRYLLKLTRGEALYLVRVLEKRKRHSKE